MLNKKSGKRFLALLCVCCLLSSVLCSVIPARQVAATVEPIITNSNATSGYVNGVAVGVPTPPPAGAITYDGIINLHPTMKKVYASVTGNNETYADVTGTIMLMTVNAQGETTRTVTKDDVVFRARINNRNSIFSDRQVIESEYTPGESFVLTFSVNGNEQARFTREASKEANETDQYFSLFSERELTAPNDQTITYQRNLKPDDSVWNWPTIYGDGKVARWDGDRIGAIGITIDDNLVGDHATWRRLGAYYDIPLSWVLIGGDSESRASDFRFAPRESWLKNQAAGYGLESHTYTHWTDIETLEDTPEREALVRAEYSKSVEAISRLTGGVVPLVVGFPGGSPYGPTVADKELAKDYFAFERGGPSASGYALSAGDGITEGAYKGFINTLFNPASLYYSVSGYGGYHCVYFHSVGSGKDDAVAASMLRYLHVNSDKVWTGVKRDVLAYMRECATASLTTSSVAPNQIVLELTDKMHDDVYQYPLTIKLKLDDNWNGVKVEQDGKTTYGTIVDRDNEGRCALIKAVPDRGDITVTPVSAAEAAAGAEKSPALSEASLYSMEYQSSDSVIRTVPGFVSSQKQGGEYVMTVPPETEQITLMARATYSDAVISFSAADGVLDLTGGDASMTVTVTSADGAVQTDYVVHVKKEIYAAPLAENILFEQYFSGLEGVARWSGADNNWQWNEFTSECKIDGDITTEFYQDPTDKTGNMAVMLGRQSDKNYYSILRKSHIRPKRAELGINLRAYLVKNAVNGYGNVEIQFGGKMLVFMTYDAGNDNYKWYIGGNATTGIYGGTVALDRWTDISLHVKASNNGAKISDCFANSTVTARFSQADNTNKVVTTTIVEPGVSLGWDNDDASTEIAFRLGSLSAVRSEMLLDDIVFYDPVSDEQLIKDRATANLTALTYQADQGAEKPVSGFSTADATSSYEVMLPYGTTEIAVNATPQSGDANVTYNPANGFLDVSGGSGTVVVTVTSSDGVFTNMYTVNFTVNTTDIPVYSKLYKYHFDYNWLTVEGALNANASAAGNDGATNTSPDGRWSVVAGGNTKIKADPVDTTNKCFYLAASANTTVNSQLKKDGRIATGAFIASGRVYIDPASKGDILVRYNGKRLISFYGNTTNNLYSWRIGTDLTESNMYVETGKWISYSVYAEPNGTDWSKSSVTVYVSGELQDTDKNNATQSITTASGFDMAHDGQMGRTFDLVGVAATYSGGRKAYAYVDDIHLYQPGLMQASASSATVEVPVDGNIHVKMLTGDTLVGDDIGKDKQMGQHLQFTTVKQGTVSIVPTSEGTAVTPLVSVNPNSPDTIAVSFAETKLLPGTEYKLMVTNSIKDVAGHGVDPHANSIVFTTAGSPSAFDYSLEVQKDNDTVEATFDYYSPEIEDVPYQLILAEYTDKNQLLDISIHDIDGFQAGQHTERTSLAVNAAAVKAKAFLWKKDSMDPLCEAKEIDLKQASALKVLAVGNSFSTDALQWVYDIAKDCGIEKVVLGNLYIPGCSVDMHLSNAINNSKSYTYYKNTTGTWESASDKTLEDGIIDEDWDVITLQQASPLSGVASTYGGDLSSLINYINQKKTNSTAKLAWHMTWAYQANSTHSGFDTYNKNQMTMYNAIVDAVKNNADNRVEISYTIPAGTAIQNVRTSYLGDTLTRDGYHLSYNVGRYIAGLTWVHKITGLPIDNVTYVPNSTELSEDVLKIVKEAVKAAVEKPFEVTQSSFTTAPGDEWANYNLVELGIVGSSYWNSNAGFTRTTTSNSTAGNLKYYISTKMFSKAEIPNGSFIVLDAGYRYRPEGWKDLQTTNAVRPSETQLPIVEVNDAWWGDFTYRSFNISASGTNIDISDKVEETASHFKIYLPKSQ